MATTAQPIMRAASERPLPIFAIVAEGFSLISLDDFFNPILPSTMAATQAIGRQLQEIATIPMISDHFPLSVTGAFGTGVGEPATPTGYEYAGSTGTGTGPLTAYGSG